jgi:hypothetical protein
MWCANRSKPGFLQLHAQLLNSAAASTNLGIHRIDSSIFTANKALWLIEVCIGI